MNAADTSASSAIADWTPLTVVCRSCTTAAIDTFITDVSTTRTNIAIASRIASLRFPADSSVALVPGPAVMAADPPRSCALSGGQQHALPAIAPLGAAVSVSQTFARIRGDSRFGSLLMVQLEVLVVCRDSRRELVGPADPLKPR